MKIDSIMVQDGAAAYYDEGMRNVFEDHLDYLRTLSSTVVKAVDPALAYQYENDLMGLFQQMGIQSFLHYVVLRLNGFRTYNTSLGDTLMLLIPNASDVDKIKQSYTSKNRIS